MSSDRAPSLRSTFARIVVLSTGIALVAAAALVVLTSWLHRTTTLAASSADAVWLSEEAELDLLLHARVQDAVVRAEVESGLKQKLTAARRLFAGQPEHGLVADAEVMLDAYLAASSAQPPSDEKLEAAQAELYAALERLVDASVSRARDAQAQASRLDRLGNVVGIGTGIALVLLGLAFVAWLRVRAFEPIFALADAFERFGRGEMNARVDPRGPEELREMGRRFNAMSEALAGQHQQRLAFLGGVAHDLKNPLAALQLALARMPAGEPLPPEPKLRQTLERLRTQLTRMRRMIDDLLDVAAMERGKLELHPADVDAAALAREVAGLFEDTTDRPFVVTVPPEPVAARCDPLRLEQVLTNLVSNAIKYSPEDTEIGVGVEASANDVVFWVKDHGIGIAEEDRDHIFEAYRRVARRSQARGLGLGLFVVRRIVEAHGGHVEVESRPGAGATFRVVLPGLRLRAGHPGQAGGDLRH